MTRREHWEEVYRTSVATEVSWFQTVPTTSLSLIEAAGAGPAARVIDIGGGTSCLVDHLLDLGFRNLTVLDFSRTALEQNRRRLAGRAGLVTWADLDITEGAPDGEFDLWHDRAVFHFLTEPEERRAYVAALSAALAPGAYAIVTTFGENGPQRCSGLDVLRYSPEALHAALGEGFELVRAEREVHRTPAGREQAFVCCLFRRPLRSIRRSTDPLEVPAHTE